MAAVAVSGSRALPDGQEVTSQTAFLWFSMTKIVTATVAMQLSEEGVLDLDEPIGRHLGEVVPTQVGGVTSRHLLSHTSGLPNPVPLRWVHSAGVEGPDVRELVWRLAQKHKRLQHDPGRVARYTNLGFLLLGAVLEISAKTPFTSLVRRRVLEPLGMSRTGFVYPSEDRALGHHRAGRLAGLAARAIVPRSIGLQRSGRFLRLDPFYVDGPAYGGLVGSVIDAAKFLHGHVSGGILSNDGMEAMRDIRHRGRPVDTGLGWFRTPQSRKKGLDVVEHLGGGVGFYNLMRLQPEKHSGVVVMGNATRHGVLELADDVLQLVP